MNQDDRYAATYRDQVAGVWTGWFHYSKQFLYTAIRPFLPKIVKGVDSVYSKTRSTNAAIFKQILGDIDSLDMDTGKGSAPAGFTQKSFYLLMAKFLICLYEYDPYYSLRIDFFLKSLLERQKELYFDEMSEPSNWYPTMRGDLLIEHFKKRGKYV